MAGFSPELKADEVESAFRDLSNLSPLVHGGQGAVFSGKHARHGDVVLKVVLPRYEERSRREIQALEAIELSHIVSLLAHGYVEVRDETCPFTLTEMIPGTDLRKLIEDGRRLDESQGKRLLQDMACALDTLWQSEIVHRDVKPANIMWTTTEDAVLIDLGIARHLSQSDLTEYGHWLGTVGFMSPEQASGERDLTVRADVFALGVTTYYALSGQHPFGSQDAIMAGKMPAPLSSAAPVSTTISNLVASMMAARPIERPTAKQLLEVLA